MTASPWWPIEYRDFWDVPRAIVVRAPGMTLFLDCPFRQDLDEFAPDYAVYVLPEDVAR